MATIASRSDDAAFAQEALEPEGYYDDGSDFGATARNLISIVRNQLILIVAIITAAVGLAVVATMLQTPRYTAATAVQINNQSADVLGDRLGDSKGADESDSVWDTDRFLNTQIEIVRSRSLAERVATRLNLFGDPQFLVAMDAPPFDGNTGERQRHEAVIDMVRSALSVNLPRDSRIASIAITSIDPAMSAKIANAYAEEFIQSNLRRKFDSSAYARSFVAQQMEEARVRLENSERELNAYARQAGLIRSRAPSPGGAGQGGDIGTQSVTQASLSQLNEAANRAKADLAAAEAKWRAESAVPLMSSQSVLSNPAIQQLLTLRSQVEGQLQSQRTKYLADHPTVQGLQAQLNSINAQIRSVATGIRAAARNEYVAASEAAARLRRQVDELQGATMSEQDRSVRYNTLAREADTNRQVYDGLLQRFRELNAASGISASNISVIDAADPPRDPSSPKLLQNLIIGLFFGLIVALAAAFLRHQLDDRIRIPEDVESKVQLPLLGVIPKESGDDLAAQLADPKSPVSEAYASLRGSLLHSTTQGLPPVLLITSSQQSEGKSTTSMATAAAISRVGKKVLLIDADMRRPSVHHRLGLQNDEGISTLLTSPATDPLSVVKATDEENLSVVVSGPHPPNPSELLSSPRMAEVLDIYSKHFDAVIVDSPPVLGLADAPVLSALADGVAFVIEADSGQPGAVKAALRRLRAMRPRIVGAVLTKFDPKKGANRYSSYYGYEYYRYSPEKG